MLLGVTGSGKTFTMANVVERVQKPTLVMSHNKTLAAQLYAEFKTLFPENAVHFFVSYYDYYQPEAYVPPTDTYIEKDSSINEGDRQAAAVSQRTPSSRGDDVLIVARRLLHLRPRLAGSLLWHVCIYVEQGDRNGSARSCSISSSSASTSGMTSIFIAGGSGFEGRT